MVIFHRFLYVYQRVALILTPGPGQQLPTQVDTVDVGGSIFVVPKNTQNMDEL